MPASVPTPLPARHATCRRSFALRRFFYAASACAIASASASIRSQAAALGRAPGDIKMFLGATIVTAETDAQAQEKFAEYQRYASSEAALVHAAASMGIDFNKFDIDEPIATEKSQANQRAD